VGNQLVDAKGNPVQLRGVNHSGTEYMCVGGWGFFDGEPNDASLDAIAAWKANAVRIPLNEHCWLGVNGVPASHSGTAYQNAIAAYAARILAHGMTPILELHWSAPGTTLADGQWPMPDSDHTPTFWHQVATRFGADRRIILELFNEPYPDDFGGGTAAWTCWRDGGLCSDATYTRSGTPIDPYDVAGMQDLVDAVRGAGAENVILAGGVRYSNDLSQWLAYAPVDPLNNLGAAWHVYSTNLCASRACLDAYVAPVASVVPVVTTEFGEVDSVESPYTGEFLRLVTGFLDQRGAGYLAWTWNTWEDDLSLIGSYDGTPYGQYGTDYRAHLRSVHSGAGGEGGEGGMGGTGGTGPIPDPLECNPIASSGLVADFTYQGGPTDNAPFGDASTLAGGEYVYPFDTGDGVGLSIDVSNDTWHVTGNVAQPPNYSGFGLYFVTTDVCTKIDASAFAGIEFELASSSSMPASLTVSIATAANEVSATWLNEYTTPENPTSSFGRCIPSGFPPDQYDGTCVAPSATLLLTAGPSTTVSLRFADFTGGLPAAAIDPSEITGITWTLPDGTYDLDLVIDDFRFVP
jgi:hypothetical protein